MKFRIKRVDMDGYCGRENHPEPSDVGLIVVPVAMDTQVHQEHESYPFLDGGMIAFPELLPYLDPNHEGDGETFVETCFTCVTADGRLLDLMDFELEPAE